MVVGGGGNSFVTDLGTGSWSSVIFNSLLSICTGEAGVVLLTGSASTVFVSFP